MRILSLFDGMACGMLAMQRAGVTVDRYVAFEIDKYAIQTSTHNFPMIEHRGDVFQADFTEYRGFAFLIGGSPCTYWSIAQKNNRETEASGIGWELFCQYVRALHEAQPMYFIYENNKSMSTAIRKSITEVFGFEPVYINSALVSAQHRQRLYWVGKRNLDGTYSRVNVDQPEDRGILLRDVLDNAYCYRCTAEGKSFCLDACYWKTPGSPEIFLEGGHARANRSMVAESVEEKSGFPFCETNGKAYALTASYGKASANNTLERNQRTCVAIPVNTTTDGKAQCLRATCYKDGCRNIVGNDVDRKTGIAEPLAPCKVGEIGGGGQGNRIYSVEGKSVSQTATSGGLGSNTGLYAISVGNMYEKQGQNGQLFSIEGKSKTLSAGTGVSGRGIGSSNSPKICIPVKNESITLAMPCEYDENGYPTKAVSCTDGKVYPVYRVKDGQITIKGKQYPIKLADGYYIIRKLTVIECKRLQTVPEWYEFPVSDTQAYKMLGNGWTVEVIAHLISATQ